MLKFILIAVGITFAAGKTPHVKNVKGKTVNRRSDILAQKEPKRPEPAPMTNVTLGEEIATNHKALNSTEPAVARSPDILPQKDTKHQEPAPVLSTEPAVARSPDYHELIKDFGREVKIDDCNSAIDMAQRVDFNLRDIIGTNVSSHLNDLTEGFIQGETQFTPRSSLSVNHCDKLFFFENLRSKAFKYDESVRLPDDQPLNLVFNYVDMHKYMSDSRTNPTVVEIPHVTVDGRGSIEMDGDPDYRFELNKSSRKKSGIADRKFVIKRDSDGHGPSFRISEEEKYMRLAIPDPDLARMEGIFNMKYLEYTGESETFEVGGVGNQWARRYKYRLYGKDVWLFCKKDLLNERCAFIGYYKVNDRRNIEAPTFYNLDNFQLYTLRNKWQSCFFKSESVVFQSSKYFIEADTNDIKLDQGITDAINQSIHNRNPPKSSHVRQPPTIFPGTCFRTIRKGWPEEGSDTSINIFPRPQGFLVTIPDYPPHKSMYTMIRAITNGCVATYNPHKKLRFFTDERKQLISLEYLFIDVHKNELFISFKPTNQTEDGDPIFQLFPKLPFAVIRTSSILFRIENINEDRAASQWSKPIPYIPPTSDINVRVGMNTQNIPLHGNLEKNEDDEMLGSKFSWILKKNSKDEYQATIRFHVPSSKHAILGLKIEDPKAGYHEADGNGYLTTFRSLQNLTFIRGLKLIYDMESGDDANVKFNAGVNLEKIEPFVSTPDLTPDDANYKANKDHIENLIFQLIYNPSTKSVSTCLYSKTPTKDMPPQKISTFLDAVQQKVFFEQDWIYYERIGVVLSPSVEDSDHFCQNAYSDTTSEEIMYHTKKSYPLGGNLVEKIDDFGLQFEINFDVVINTRSIRRDRVKPKYKLLLEILNLDRNVYTILPKAWLLIGKVGDVDKVVFQLYNGYESIYDIQSTGVKIDQRIYIKMIQTRKDGFYYQFKAFVNFKEVGSHQFLPERTVSRTVKVQSDTNVQGEIKKLEIKGRVEHIRVQPEGLEPASLTSRIAKQITHEISLEYLIRFDIFIPSKDYRFSLYFGENDNKFKITFGNLEVTVCKNVPRTGEQCTQKIAYNENEWSSIRITQTYDKTEDDRTKSKLDPVINGVQGDEILTETPVKIKETKLSTDPPNIRNDIQVRNWMITDVHKKIGVQINGLLFTCPESDVKDNNGKKVKVKAKACEFLADNIGKYKPLNADNLKMKGWMDHNDMLVQGKVMAEDVDLNIFNNYKFMGIVNVMLTKSSLTFVGDMNMYLSEEEQGEGHEVTIRMYGDIVDVHVSKAFDFPIKANINGIIIGLIFREAFVVSYEQNSMKIKALSNSPEVVLGDYQKVVGVWFKKRSLTHVVIRSYRNFDLFACKERLSKVKFRKLMRSIGKPNQKGFLEGSHVTDLCIGQSHSTNQYAVGKIFSARFTLSGNVTTTFGRSGDLPFTLPLEFTDANNFCVDLPPLRWGSTIKGNIKGKEEEEEPEEDNIEKKIVPPFVELQETDLEFHEEIRANIKEQKPALRVVDRDYLCEFTNIALDESTIEYQVNVRPGRGETFEKVCVAECYKLTKDTKDTENEEERYDGVKYIGERAQCICLKGTSYPSEETKTTEYQSCVITVNEDYPVEMFQSKEKQTKGPRLCHNLQGHGSATFEGYLRTFLFEIYARFDGYVDDYNKGWITTYKWNSGNVIQLANRDIWGYVEINLSKRKKMKPVDPENMKMNLKITFRNFEDKIRKKLWEQLLFFTYKLHILRDTMIEFKDKFTTRAEVVKDQISTYERVVPGSARKRFEIAKIELARAIKSFKRDCSYECGYEKYPGWVIDKKCSTNQNGGHMSCIRQKRDGNIASDVNCISNCEAERARSYADARELQKRTNEAAEVIDEKELCEQDGKRLHQNLIDYARELDGIRQNIENDAQQISPDVLDTLSSSIYSIDIEIKDVQKLRGKYTQCQKLTVRLTDNREESYKKYICFDRFYDDLALKYRNKMIPKLYKKYNRLKDKYEQAATKYRRLLSPQTNINESKAARDLEEKWKFCSEQGGKSRSPRRSSVMDTAPPFYPVDFVTYEAGTEEAFEYTSPWKVAEKRDVTFDLSQVDLLQSKKAVSLPKNESSCSATKRTVNDFNDIASYIQRWTNEYQKAKDNIEEINQRNNDPKSFVWHSVIGNTSYPEEYVMLMKRWHTKAEDGMKRWYELETDHLSRFNKESLPSIRKQLQYMYTDNEHKTLRDFFNARNVDGKTAIQRQHIANATDDTFTNLSKTLLDILENGKSLTDIAATVETVMHNTAQLQKRTIQC